MYSHKNWSQFGFGLVLYTDTIASLLLNVYYRFLTLAFRSTLSTIINSKVFTFQLPKLNFLAFIPSPGVSLSSIELNAVLVAPMIIDLNKQDSLFN